ncbi:MFS transporter [Streptomyces sioyaensis]|uniref:MFS transporter n=1 Tax=Streptomyces sioyaensis TaxID=67364 RepID=UPI0037D23AC0
MLTETTQTTPHRWAALGVLCASLLMVGMDLTVLHVAVPTISRELLPSGSELLWIADSYALTVAAGLITCGTLGDRFGRKRMLMAGFVVFGLASAGAALSASPGQLIAARAALGIAGAMIMASTPAIIRAVFPDDRERSVAIGLWTAANSVGVSVGPLLGGLLIEHFWWGSVFLVNVPIVLLAVAGGALLVPESRNTRPHPWDAASAGMSAVGLGTVVYAFQQLGEHDGSQPVVWATALLGVALLIGFVVRQRRIRHPLLDVAQFADRRFSLSALCILGCYGARLRALRRLLPCAQGALRGRAAGEHDDSGPDGPSALPGGGHRHRDRSGRLMPTRTRWGKNEYDEHRPGGRAYSGDRPDPAFQATYAAGPATEPLGERAECHRSPGVVLGGS